MADADAVAGAGWTDERVEILGRLWAEGLSASRIAAHLGGGVTRNAVIGKVHRLGLAGRVKAGQQAASKPARPRPQPPGAVIEFFRPEAPSAAEANGATAVASGSEIAIPTSKRVSILDLRESSCRWPIGDPTTVDFGFCGGRAATGHPYCVAHCQIAYQPAAERRRLRV